jgi:hypothetical protein
LEIPYKKQGKELKDRETWPNNGMEPTRPLSLVAIGQTQAQWANLAL